MTPDEYQAQQAVISASIVRYVLQFGKLFAKPALSLVDWLRFVDFLYPTVVLHRQQAAQLARTFYDAQRAGHYPELPRNDVPLEGYTTERFAKDIDPARKRMQQADSTEDAVGQVALQAVRSVENAGRQQIIHAVQDDSQLQEAQKAGGSKVVRGWARVATGRETCAWCLMLVSRGPVYYSAESAGLDLDSGSAERMIAAGEDVSDNMQQWHPGCDCKVVPVFKNEGWPGQAAQQRALQAWNDATKTAIAEEDSDPDRTHNYGKNKGDEFTRNQRALNALRRQFAAGELNPAQLAGIAA